jgi:hypothetical protein
MTEKKAVWTILAIIAGLVIALVFLLRAHRVRELADRLSVPIEGAVVQRDADPKNELPIPDVVITASDGTRSAATRSDSSGYFKLVLHKRVLTDQPITVTFHHPRYEPFTLVVPTGRFETPSQLYVAAMTPIVPVPAKAPSPAPASARAARPPATLVANIRVRYTINTRAQTNVGSATRTFQVVNKGNVPCDHIAPCSPDGKWKAATKTVTLDAGDDNSYGNVSASCIAGPCPFTKIDSSGFIHGGRTISVTALNWSDTATFLMEAEVYHTAINSEVRELYPVIFGQTLNFTLPPTQEGVSLEAEIDGAQMVFPLGPNPSLSWATCNVRTGQEEAQTTVYRCELKPGYRF